MSSVVDPGWVKILILLCCDERYHVLDILSYRVSNHSHILLKRQCTIVTGARAGGEGSGGSVAPHSPLKNKIK